MRRDPKLYLYDIQQAIREFTAGKTLADYQNALMMCSTVERQVVIIAEVLHKLSDLIKKLSLISDDISVLLHSVI